MVSPSESGFVNIDDRGLFLGCAHKDQSLRSVFINSDINFRLA